jgi:glycine cleavage system transcriptional repressor
MQPLHHGHVILTALGADRPGLVDDVSGFVAERGGNVEDSRMVTLHGQFAMVMLVAGTDEALGRVVAELGELSERGGIKAEATPAHLSGGGPVAALPYRLHTWAMDHPGLLKSVSHLMAELGVNIESADTRLKAAPVTGAPVFEMELVLAVPGETSLATLRERIAQLCDDLNMDWQLTAL